MKNRYIGFGVMTNVNLMNGMGGLTIKYGHNIILVGTKIGKHLTEIPLNRIRRILLNVGIKENEILGIYNFLK